MKGFEGADGEETQEVNAQREMERARHDVQEREERKKLTMGGAEVPQGPRMNIQVCSPLVRGRRVCLRLCRVRSWARVHGHDISSQRCSRMHIRTVRPLKHRLLKASGTGKKPATSTVRLS
jgi:hypothetical protein